MVKWLRVHPREIQGFSQSDAIRYIELRSAILAQNQPHSIGCSYRDGLHWSKPDTFFPVIVDSGASGEPLPFEISPFAAYVPEWSPENHLAHACDAILKKRWGWHWYEWRFQAPQGKKWFQPYPVPMWDGSELGNRRVFVWSEQGYGDVIQFSRFLPADERYSFRCYKPLERLISSTWPGRFVDKYDGEDFHIPLLSLPLALLRGMPLIDEDDFCPAYELAW